MKRIDFNNLETERLIIRRVLFDDYLDYFNFLNDDLTSYLSGWKKLETIEESKSVIKQIIIQNNYYSIFLKSEKKVIGFICVNSVQDDNLDKENGLELSYTLSRNYWNNGFMTEALKCFIAEIFNQDVLFLVINYLSNNEASKRVALKNGFMVYDQKMCIIDGFTVICEMSILHKKEFGK